MKRAVLLTPLAIAPTACVTEHAETHVTWDEALREGAERLPAATNTELVERWQLPPQSPWAAYSKLTLPSAREELESSWGEVRDIDAMAQTSCAADQIAAVGVPADVMWLVDLPGAQSVHFTAALSRSSKDPVAPVLTFNNWPSNDELIPTRDVLAALESERPKLPAPGIVAAPVFALDADRLAFAGEDVDTEQYDNRYIVGPHDLPEAQFLLQQGIRRVVYLVDSRAERELETDDLNPILRAYQDAGLQLSLIDLSDLCSMRPPPLQADERPAVPAYSTGYVFWEPWFLGHAYWAQPRPLRCNLELFAHAHGGFGGRHAHGGFGHAGSVGFHGGSGGFHAASGGHGFGGHGGGG